MRRTIIRIIVMAGLVIGLAAPTAVIAQTPGSPAPPALPAPGGPEEMARQALEMLMRALTLAIQNLPQYEMPTMNERGDIIIRRINPPPRPPPAPPGQGKT
ncbi:MAG: hypothetical protein HY246_11395 [Proteobacteria bacterium]|nr:hypothetical protein [Pseudomonadota bacterium]